MFRADPPIAVLEPSQRGEGRGLIDPAGLDALEAAVGELERRADLRAAVLAPSSESAFSEGFDARSLLALETRADADDLWRRAQRLVYRIRACKKPIVAALRGRVAGAALEIALACTERIAVSDRATALALPETRLGLVPWMGGLGRLAELAGVQVALAMTVDGQVLSAHEAHAHGLVTALAPTNELVSEAAALALGLASGEARFGSRPHRVHGLAHGVALGQRALLSLARRRVRKLAAGNHPAHEHAIDILDAYVRGGDAARAERHAFGELVTSSASRTLLELEGAEEELQRRTARERERVPGPRAVVVLGTTSSAARLATSAASAGLDVTWTDSAEDAVLREADVVVDATDGDLATKRRTLGRLEKIVRPDALVLVQSRSQRVSDLTREATHPSRIAGLYRSRRVLEVVVPTHDARSSAWASRLASSPEDLVLVTRDGAGRFTARLDLALVNEGLFARDDGATSGELCDAVLDWGFDRDPAAILGEVGAQTFASDAMGIASAHGVRIELAPRLRDLATGAAVLGALPRRATVPRRGAVAPEELQVRAALAVVNEAHRMFDEGLVTSVRDADVAAVRGAGFPAFRGGPFAYARSMGKTELLARFDHYRRKLGPRFTPARSLVELV